MRVWYLSFMEISPQKKKIKCIREFNDLEIDSDTNLDEVEKVIQQLRNNRILGSNETPQNQ